MVGVGHTVVGGHRAVSWEDTGAREEGCWGEMLLEPYLGLEVGGEGKEAVVVGRGQVGHARGRVLLDG